MTEETELQLKKDMDNLKFTTMVQTVILILILSMVFLSFSPASYLKDEKEPNHHEQPTQLEKISR